MEKHTVAVETHDRSTRSDTIIILLIVSILLNLIALYFLVGGVFPKKEVMTTSGTTVSAPPPAFTLEKNLYDTIMKVEYEKVGGKENYDLINQANLKQLQTNLPQIRQYLENTGSTAQGQNDPNQPTPSNNGTFTSEEVLALTKDAYIEGNKDANIILIEYSDIECPFCIRQVNETKPFNAMKEKYGDTVSHTFKNNKGVNHPGTETKALASLCAGKIGGTEKYSAFYREVFAQSTLQAPVAVSKLPEIAQKVGLDKAKWQACLDNKETQDRFVSETAEANRMGLGGTPGNLILNKKTGKYVKIEGAYPADSFLQAVESVK